MDFTIGCTLRYAVAARTPFVFNLEAVRMPRQRVLSERLITTPDLGEPDRFDAPESGNRFIRYIVPPGSFQIEYEATVALDPQMLVPTDVTEIAGGSLPMDVLPYLNASRYCQSDRLSRFANRQFGAAPAGHQRVTAICNWIRDNVDYQAGTSDALTSAYDTLGDRAGVCRDFAHLAITLCRAVGIPARYISAYAWQLSPPDFHAVFEAFLLGPRRRRLVPVRSHPHGGAERPGAHRRRAGRGGRGVLLHLRQCGGAAPVRLDQGAAAGPDPHHPSRQHPSGLGCRRHRVGLHRCSGS